MTNKNTTNIVSSKRRLLQYLDYKDVSIKAFFDKTNIKRGFLDSNKLDSVISDKFIAKIIAIYEDLNIVWLISGKGEMTIPKKNNHLLEETTEYYTKTKKKLKEQQIPLYDIDAIAGFTPIFTDLNTLKPIDFLHIPNSPESDGALYASGDSMYPIIKGRDILCFKFIKDIKNDIFWGKTYILDLALSNDDLLTTKYINRGKDDNHILLVSENKHYQDKQIHISKIRGLAIVKMVVKMS